MPRLTLDDCINSRLPEIIGSCQADRGAIAAAVNAAQERLVYAPEAGDEGWMGSFAHVAYTMLQSDPYITLDRYAGRLMAVDVCKKPIMVQNQFYEYLMFTTGLEHNECCTNVRCNFGQAYDRGTFPSFRDMTKGHIIRVRALDPLDQNTGKRTLVQGTDTADYIICSQDATLRVQGHYVTLTTPWVDVPEPYNSLTGIQKDITNGQVTYWDVDPVTAAETLILTMEPGETVAGYRRYYFSSLPQSCCPIVYDANGNATVQVSALVKLNMIPVVVPTDYLLIQSKEAIIAECQSARYAGLDTAEAKMMGKAAHKEAIGYLQGQLTHNYGVARPAISFTPFGSAHLYKQKIGTLI